MEKARKINVIGVAHWSWKGEFDEEKQWEWWIEIDGAELSYEERLQYELPPGEKAVAFAREMIPLFPDDVEKRLLEPEGVPGGSWNLSLPLRDCKNPEEAEKVIEKYFPILYARA